jgi:hypothetical protein
MNKITKMRGMQLLAGTALMAIAGLCQAQWVWVDDKGVKQFSDRAPPSSVPQKNILKAPRGMATGADMSAAPAPAAAPAAPAPKLSLADREADYKKRQAEKAESDKKATEEAAAAAQKKAACDGARAAKAQLDSGTRMRTGTNGDIMDDKQRAQEGANINKALAGC